MVLSTNWPSTANHPLVEAWGGGRCFRVGVDEFCVNKTRALSLW
jgi:hypothetical protein